MICHQRQTERRRNNSLVFGGTQRVVHMGFAGCQPSGEQHRAERRGAALQALKLGGLRKVGALEPHLWDPGA